MVIMKKATLSIKKFNRVDSKSVLISPICNIDNNKFVFYNAMRNYDGETWTLYKMNSKGYFSYSTFSKRWTPEMVKVLGSPCSLETAEQLIKMSDYIRDRYNEAGDTKIQISDKEFENAKRFSVIKAGVSLLRVDYALYWLAYKRISKWTMLMAYISVMLEDSLNDTFMLSNGTIPTPKYVRTLLDCSNKLFKQYTGNQSGKSYILVGE